MRIQTTFFRFTSIAALVSVVGISLSAGGTLQASQSATMAPTMAGTMAMAAPTMAGTMAAGGTSNAVPPCPSGIMAPTMAATMMGTMAGTMAAGPGSSATMMATMAATMAMAMPATMAGTAPAMTVVPGMSMNGCELSAKLDGKDEGGGKPGDTNGSGTATLMLSHPATGLGEVCFNITVSGIKLPAVASHIHKGAAGVAGPVVVPFSPTDANGKTSGCTENVDPKLIDDILANPANYYVNVHTTDFPGGAVRGQLSAAAQ